MENSGWLKNLTKSSYGAKPSVDIYGNTARKREHQKEMAAYHNKTSNRDADNSRAVIPSVSRNLAGITERDSKVDLYGSAQDDKGIKQPKSSFEQWNIEKTQPKLSYGQEKLMQSYNSAGSPWLDASMRKYATRQMQASEVDKQWAGGYNKSEYKSPAYARQMSYRGLKRDTYNPQEQKAIIKDGLDSAGMKYNVYAIRGDWKNAGLSAAAAIPIVGDAGMAS